MDCEFCEHLVAYLDGELPDPLQARVKEHLRGCSACAHVLEELRQTRSFLEHWAVAEPRAASRSRAWNALGRPRRPALERRRERRVWVRPLVRYALPLAAGVLVAVLVMSPWDRWTHPSVPDEVIAELPVLENMEILEAMDVLTEWENLQVLAALELAGNGEEVVP